MIKKAFKIFAFLITAIVLTSIMNALLTYRTERETGVDFGKYHEYSGVIHVHTVYSDGSGTYGQIGRTADSLGLAFAIITDHNTVQPMRDSLAGRFGLTLIIPAVEISTNGEHGHFLVIGDSVPLVPRNGVTSDSVFRDALRKRSVIILAHVFHPRNTLDWDNWDIGAFTGMELYNFDDGWRSNLNFYQINKLIAAFIANGFDPEALNYVLAYPDREMKKFDTLNTERKVIGLGSLDAHANIRLWNNLSLHFPSYQALFGLVQTVVVTREAFDGRYRHDRRLLLAAIRDGNCYVAFSGLEEARGFLFTATADSAEAIMGDSIKMQAALRLHVSLPDSDNVETQIIHDGKTVATYENAGSMELSVSQPGDYRVQAFQRRTMLPLFLKGSFPWIISNPIYVFR